MWVTVAANFAGTAQQSGGSELGICLGTERMRVVIGGGAWGVERPSQWPGAHVVYAP
jgi:hypothetical protein